MEKKDKKEINRRDFVKTVGTASVLVASSLSGCKPKSTVTAKGGTIGEVPTDKMTYRTNHNSGDKVSLLGYGCMRWPLRKNKNGEDEIDQDTVNELVDYAISHGVNYFDTAPVYVRGWSEMATGIALKRHPRDKFFIATKLSTHRENAQLRSFEGSKALYEKSKENLQVEYIDYYLLHAIGLGGMKAVMERFYDNGMLDFLLEERKAGRIRNLGWSFHGDIDTFDFLLSQHDKGKVHWDFVQIQLNYIDWQNVVSDWNTKAEYLLGELEKRNIPAVVMEPLLGGRLSRLPSEALNMLKELRPQDSAANWAFRYAGTPTSVLTVLSGMVYMEHLQENIRCYSPIEPVNETEYKVLEQVTEIMINPDYVQCTECEYCMPCPYGVNIPGVFGHYNRIISAGQKLKSSNDENYKEARRAFLVGYDRNIPKLRQASHCIACGICKPHCPQTIDIPKEMQRIDLYTEQLKQSLEF